jgi:twitching motility protein PilT
MIREGKSNQLRNIMSTSAGDGMQTLEMSLAGLIRTGTITYEDALTITTYPKELARELGRTGVAAA